MEVLFHLPRQRIYERGKVLQTRHPCRLLLTSRFHSYVFKKKRYFSS